MVRSTTELPPRLTKQSAPADRAASAASTTTGAGVCSREPANVPTQLAPNQPATSAATPDRSSDGVVTRNAREAPTRASSAGQLGLGDARAVEHAVTAGIDDAAGKGN